MGRSGRLAAVGIAAAVLSGSAATGVVFAGGQPSRDRVALRPAQARPDHGTEQRIDALIKKMTLDEKLNQLTLLSDGQITDADAKAGVGGVFSLTDPAKIDHYQQIAVQQSRLHIPILFAYDTIHGFRTVFPIPLATASSFDPSVAAADHSIGAAESASDGIKQIYSPMVDVSHDPRWGRISEAGGEDPYLNSRDGRRAREGRAGQRLQRRQQGRHVRQALRRLRGDRERARLQHDRHVAARGFTTTSCRRSRRRSTPAPTR